MSVKLSTDAARRILDRVATSLNTPVSIADASGRVLASTDPTRLGARLEVAERAIAAGEAAERRDRGEAMSLPLVYADAVVGAIVLDGVDGQGHELARVAKTLAELIIHQMTVIEQLPRQKWARGKFLHDLLHGRLGVPVEGALQEARIFGIDLAPPRVVALIDFDGAAEQMLGGAGPTDALPRIARTLRLEQLHADLVQQARRALAPGERDVYGFIDDRMLAVLAVVEEDQPAARRRALRDALQRFLASYAQRSGLIANAGIGRCYDGWQTLPRSFADARFALETGAHLHGAGRVFLPEELGLAGFVCSEDRALKVDLAAHLLQPLDDAPELMTTLVTFLQADLSPSRASEALHIHRHTLAYRLGKIGRLTGLDPRRFDDAVQFCSALVLRKAGCLP